MKPITICQLITISLAMLLLPGPSLWAWDPPIRATLKFLNKARSYHREDAVLITVSLENISKDDDIIIAGGFGAKAENDLPGMRLIDPAGRLLLPIRQGQPVEYPDAPPLPFVMEEEGKPVRVAPCEIFPRGRSYRGKTFDLRKYYPLELPGYYLVQVQFSAMIFNQQTCDVKKLKWQGVIKSEPWFFYWEGKADVKK